MKVFTNVHREYLGGMTTTNNAFLFYLANKKEEIVGLEYDTVRCMKGPFILNGINNKFFEHYILNIFDLPISKIAKTAKNLYELKNYYRPAIESVKELLDRTKPDVALINGTSYYPWILATAAHEFGIPIVLRYHGVSSREWMYEHDKADKKILEMEKSMSNMASAFIFPSDLCKSIAEDEIAGKKIPDAHIIFNPVSVTALKPRKPAGRRIAMVARWYKIKNISAFFELDRLLYRQKWKHSTTLISEKVDIGAIPEKIKLVAPKPYEKLCDFYRSQDLMVVSSFFETFCNVPMEALCVGTPVMVNNTVGCAEVLKETGLDEMIVDFSDMEAVAIKAKKLCGRTIPKLKLDKVRRMLDPEEANRRIYGILKKFAGKR